MLERTSILQHLFPTTFIAGNSLAWRWSERRPVDYKHIIVAVSEVGITQNNHRQHIIAARVAMNENYVFLAAIPLAVAKPIVFLQIDLRGRIEQSKIEIGAGNFHCL
jgi:hypothetical protein